MGAIDGGELRRRVLEGGLDAVARVGLGRATVDDVAAASGVSRATIYRHFPDGRDQLMTEVVDYEVGRFFGRLGEAVRDSPDLRTLLADALGYASAALDDHVVLQRVLAAEPERLLPLVTTSAHRILPRIAAFLVPWVEREREAGRLRAGVDSELAADFLARMFLSLIAAPGRLALADPCAVRRFVGERLCGALLR